MCDDFLTKLAPREFIQGDTFILAFQFTDMDGSVIMPSQGDITWNLCTFDQFENLILSLNGTDNPDQVTVDSGTGIVYVHLYTTNTEAIDCGKYVQQPIITYNGNNYIRAWGEVVFRSKVGGTD